MENRRVRQLLACLALSALLVVPSTTSALDIPLLDLRAGVKGGVNINILSDVFEEDSVPVYPGYFGIGWALGGALSFHYTGPLIGAGIAIEFLYSSENATGTIEFDRDLGSDGSKEESDMTLSASGLHLPIYAQVAVGAGVARFFLNLGVDINFSRSGHELVVEQSGDAEPFSEGCDPGVDCDPFPARDFGVNGIDSSTFALIGLGLDIDVGPVTVPVEFRWLVNPNFGNSITDRTNITGDLPAFTYNNEWHYQVFVLFGANYKIF